jgi:hypothetical protein
LGFSVLWADLEGLGNFDLIVTTPTSQFEVECKTISEELENPIKSELSVAYFEEIEATFKRSDSKLPSGVVDIRMKGKSIEPAALGDVLESFFRGGNLPLDLPSVEVNFQPMPQLMEYFSSDKNLELILELNRLREKHNPQSLVVASRDRFAVFNIIGSRQSRLVGRIAEIVKDACRQLSGARPGIVWTHFLGLTEDQFRRLAQRSTADARTAFNTIARSAFNSPNRSYVSRIMFSADAGRITDSGAQGLSVDGPIYEARNWAPTFQLDESF